MRLLTSDEQALVARTKKDPRPSYWSANLGALSEISPEFEAFLIVLGDARRQAMLSWLSAVGTAGNSYIDAESANDELLTEALAVDNLNQDAELALLDVALLGYDQARESFAVSGFADVSEVSMLLTDAKYPLDRISERRETLRLEQTVGAVANTMYTSEMTADRLRQLRSWTRVLLAY